MARCCSKACEKKDTSDQPLPQEIALVWKHITDKKKYIRTQIPRRMSTLKGCAYQLIAFTDALQLAYGAAVYLRSINGYEVQSHLIFTKMRLMPIRMNKKSTEETVSLPCLELLGVLLGTR